MKQPLIALDQFLNTVVWIKGDGFGYADETMSAAAWRLEQEGKLAGRIFRPLIDKIFWFDPQHCKTSFESEVARAKYVLKL